MLFTHEKFLVYKLETSKNCKEVKHIMIMIIATMYIFFTLCDIWLTVDFQYGFKSCWSTAGLLTVASDRIAMAFNRSGATRAVALDISKAFDKVWHAGLLHRLRSFGISGQILGLICSFLSNRGLRVVLDGKNI